MVWVFPLFLAPFLLSASSILLLLSLHIFDLESREGRAYVHRGRKGSHNFIREDRGLARLLRLNRSPVLNLYLFSDGIFLLPSA